MRCCPTFGAGPGRQEAPTEEGSLAKKTPQEQKAKAAEKAAEKAAKAAEKEAKAAEKRPEEAEKRAKVMAGFKGAS